MRDKKLWRVIFGWVILAAGVLLVIAGVASSNGGEAVAGVLLGVAGVVAIAVGIDQN